MKLAGKLAIAVVLVMSLVFGLRGYQAARRELARAKLDLREDHFIIGRALRPAIKEVWRLEGRERALAVLGFADDRIQRARKVRIRWAAAASDGQSLDSVTLPAAEANSLVRDEDVTVVRTEGRELVTYVPVHLDGRLVGALNIAEPLDPHEARWQREMLAVIGRSVVGALASILAVSALGFVLIGRPVRRLAEMAKRIGSGDLGTRLSLPQRDELGQLADEMNGMSQQLAEANRRVAEEMDGRIRTLEQLRHADRLTTVGTLASGIAHELGTPLNVVSGRAKMIATGEAGGAEATDSARIIVDQVDRIAVIIRQLLDFARRRTPERRRQQLAAILEQTVRLLRPMAQKRRVELAIVEGAATIEAEVDAGQIQQALTNLIVNGIQSMPEGGRLELQLEQREAVRPTSPQTSITCACLAVTDQGRGIPAEQLPRVFEPFFTTKDVGEGTGLGLSVAFGIARDHDGWIGVQSEPGRGSRFELYLPTAAGQRQAA